MTLSQLLRIRWAVRATLLLGVAASVVANVLHAVDNPISQVIAAWPPFALLLTVELISRVPVHRKSLAFVRMLSTTAIAGIAAWISYWHMAGVAAKYGETGASAYLLPISVDGLILVASICLIELGGRISEEQAAKRAAAEAPAPQPMNAPAPAAVFADDARYDNDVPGISALVPRPLATANTTNTDAYPQFGGSDDEYLDEYEDRRTTADRTAAAGAMAVAAGERRDRDPLTATGSLPVITSDVAAAIEAALSGSQVSRGVRGGASPRNRGGISAVSGSLAGRPAGPEDPDQAQDGAPEPVARPVQGRIPAQRTATGAGEAHEADGADGANGQARRPARASAATSATTRRTTTGRITASALTGDGDNTGDNKDTGTRPRRSAAETAALAAAIETRSPGVTEAEVADELGISARRLRDIRRTTDALPARDRVTDASPA